MSAPEPAPRFPVLMRILHWLLAALLLCMLFIGVSMVTSLLDYHRLLALHRPLGVTILVLAVIRLLNRKLSTLPPFPVTSESESSLRSANGYFTA
jgi:cytochrome b561